MDELEREIGKYKLDELLFIIAEISRKLFIQNKSITSVIWKYVTYRKSQYLTVWDLAEISYRAILNSNDYRPIHPKERDIYKLNNLYIKNWNQETRIELQKIPANDKELSIFWGLSQKQLWWQQLDIINWFLRYYILLWKIPPKCNESKLPNDDLIEVTGFDIKNFSQLLLALFAYNQSSSEIKILIEDDLKKRIPIINEFNIEKCLNNFVGDYYYYRRPNQLNNPLFFKPIIKTQTNKLIISNAFIWARKFYEGIYWIIRNKYYNANLEQFIINFGEYYERYAQEVLEYYLKPQQYKKIETIENEKSADWIINTEKYILIIEQKSTLMTISLKKEYPDLYKLEEYLEKFKNAYIQIDRTIKAIRKTDKTTIKLILHFEKLYIADSLLKKRVIQLCQKDPNSIISDFSHYFFIDTEEFEKLIQILADDEEIFNKIIDKKIEYENHSTSSDDITFEGVIEKFVKIDNIRYLDSHKYLFDELLGKES